MKHQDLLIRRVPKMENEARVSLFDNQNTMKFGDLTKRGFDIIVSLIVLIFFAPVYGLIAVAIKRDTPGPVFYRGLRVGRQGKYFKILKFRTMYETAESYAGSKITAWDDARVTPLGQWLRNTKLNEFPQFWNVLKGDMSLVGPRPEDPTLAKTWPIKAARELVTVRPGITSPASVLYRDEESMLHAKDVLQKYLHDLSPDKIRLDQLYVRYRSFWLDLDTILWTALLLIPKIRAYSPPEQLLFVGPVTRLIKRYMNWFVRDVLVVFLSITAVGMVLHLFSPFRLGWLKSFEMAVAFSFLYSCVGAFLGLNHINWTKATFWDVGRLGTGWLITTGIALTIHSALHFTNRLGLLLISASSISSLPGIVLVRYRSHFATSLLSRIIVYRLESPATRERVLVVGSGRTAEHIAWLLDHPAYSKKFWVVGFIDDDLFARGMNIYGAKVIGGTKDIAKIVEQQDIGLIILADHKMALSQYRRFREAAKNTQARIVVVPDIFGSLNNLSKISQDKGATSDLEDFQCQYCLARFGFHTSTNEIAHPIATLVEQ
jgi:lipopolysaccharide/colanic/teichoic acid biosynthesis glycosyltransferase